VLLRFIPYPVTTGFTTGIAVTIFSSQIKDFFGMQMSEVPAEFLKKWSAYASEIHTCSMCTIILAVSTLGLIFLLRHFFPRFPGTILAVGLATLVAYIWGLPVETIESKFGGIPNMLPAPSFPHITLEKIQEVFPAAITIALLGGIESLLSALVADGMTGHRHRSNSELVAQGFANIGSVLFGGIPATGAIARTTANIKMGAKTPVSGMIHAITLLFLMLFLSPFAAKIPLAGLSAVLIFVAWNMSEIPHFIEILRSEWSDAVVLVITFLLTVLIDLTVAVQAGIILSAVLFLKKMSDATTVEACRILISEDANQSPEKYDSEILFREDVPQDVLVFEMKGPFFFGVSDLLHEALQRVTKKPRVFILRMRHVPMIDTTGLQALKSFSLKCQNQHIVFLITGLQPRVEALFKTSKLDEILGHNHLFINLDAALDFARKYEPQEIENQKLMPIHH
ncbi:MAG TPA: SulP family inorganic anion transporter, partial [Parachlamydiaceae bacterium]|nr:SulP family inorganic anion transporter [Parachlamydiaceae bacterium]